MNTENNDNFSLPPIQLLIPSCFTVDNEGVNLTWLHGYCLMTLRHKGAGLQLEGQVRVGERYGENIDLIRELAGALGSGNVLAGYDLTGTISRLGRLPVEANDPEPALDLLAMLKSMLTFHDPLDVAIDGDSQTEVLVQHLRHDAAMDEETRHAIEDELFERGFADGVSIDPRCLAIDLIENARACLLAVGEIYLAEEMRPLLLSAWEEWERTKLPHQLPASTILENGGGPVIT